MLHESFQPTLIGDNEDVERTTRVQQKQQNFGQSIRILWPYLTMLLDRHRSRHIPNEEENPRPKSGREKFNVNIMVSRACSQNCKKSAQLSDKSCQNFGNSM